MKKKALEDMSIDELKDRLAGIEALNPHTYNSLQSYRVTLAELTRRKIGCER